MDAASTHIRVVVCDDDADLRLLLQVLVSNDPRIEVVGEASNGREAVEAARAFAPDVVLLDIAMPEMDGLEALPLILEASPNSQVIMFSGFERGLIHHVDDVYGYIEKGTASQRIVQMIKDAAGARERAS